MKHSFAPTGSNEYGVGDGDVRCSRCWTNLPAQGGEVLDGWRSYVDSDCDEELVREILES